MAKRRSEDFTRLYERRGWALTGLAILVILGFALTLPSIYIALIRSGFLGDLLPPSGGWVVSAGLVGLTLLFCLLLVHQQSQIDRFRRQLVSDQMEQEQLRGRLGELLSLFQLGGNLQMELSLDTVAEITVRRLAATFHANEATMYLVEPDARALRPLATFGLAPKPREPEIPIGEGAAGWVARHREPVLMHASEKGARFAGFFEARPDIGSVLLLPVTVSDRAVAVLQVCRGPRADHFRLEHRDSGQLFANSIGAVIDRVQLSARLDRTAAEATAAREPDTATEAGFRDAFLSAATVELKAPITTVVAYAEVLDANDQKMTPAMRREFTARLRSEAQRVMGLVDDVLDVVRLEMGRFLLDLRKENVNRIAQAAADQARPFALGRGVEVETVLDEKVPDQLLDAVKVRQAMVRLIQNGIRFSPPKGRVTLATWLGDDHVLVEIRDSGPFVEPEIATRVFEIDAASDARFKRCKDGMGFGLHLTKRFVELHGGEVGVGPGPTGAGATFWIKLPRAEAQAGILGLEDPFAEEVARG